MCCLLDPISPPQPRPPGPAGHLLWDRRGACWGPGQACGRRRPRSCAASHLGSRPGAWSSPGRTPDLSLVSPRVGLQQVSMPPFPRQEGQEQPGLSRCCDDQGDPWKVSSTKPGTRPPRQGGLIFTGLAARGVPGARASQLPCPHAHSAWGLRGPLFYRGANSAGRRRSPGARQGPAQGPTQGPAQACLSPRPVLLRVVTTLHVS